MDCDEIDFLDNIASIFQYIYSVPEELLGVEIHATAKEGRKYKIVITRLVENNGPVEAKKRGE